MNDKYSKLFKICHYGIPQLTPLSDFNNEKINKLIEKNNLDINKFYKVEGKLYQYCYMNETVFVEIYSMEEEVFETFRVKEIIEQREEYNKECIDSKNYESLFYMIDKPFRLYWFKKLYNDIPKKKRLRIFRDIYSSMEYGFEEISKELINKVYEGYNFDRSIFDDVVTIYRGECDKSNSYKDVYSWTTDLETAKFFANRFSKGGKVYVGKIKKEDILDYIDDRNESEIITTYDRIFDIKEL